MHCTEHACELIRMSVKLVSWIPWTYLLARMCTELGQYTYEKYRIRFHITEGWCSDCCQYSYHLVKRSTHGDAEHGRDWNPDCFVAEILYQQLPKIFQTKLPGMKNRWGRSISKYIYPSLSFDNIKNKSTPKNEN